jgi:two-component system, LuxR family, sensor kinase FixL
MASQNKLERDEAANLLAAIVTASDDAIISKTLDGIVTSWNRGAELIFGYTAEEMIDEPIFKLADPANPDEMGIILARLRAGERVDHYETTRRHKDGRIIDISLTVSPIRDASGELVGASKIVRDLTERRAAESRLRQLEAELAHISRLTEMGQMASAIAHEVNQPLTAATTYLAVIQMLLQGTTGNVSTDRLPGLVQNVSTQITRAVEIMGRLRGFGKKDTPERRSENLVRVIEEAVQFAMIGTRDSGVKVDLRFTPELPSIRLDRLQIQQVIINLVRNALQAMQWSARRELTIVADQVGKTRVAVQVLDTGPGIAPEIADRLFRPFVTTKAEGIGIGLSICRTIIESHGGELVAEANPDGGTIFKFTLPAQESVEAA